MPGLQAAGVLRVGRRRVPSPGHLTRGWRLRLQGGPSGLSLHTKRLDFPSDLPAAKSSQGAAVVLSGRLALSTVVTNRQLSRALISPASEPAAFSVVNSNSLTAASRFLVPHPSRHTCPEKPQPTPPQLHAAPGASRGVLRPARKAGRPS